jgi:hypothetical protein
MVQMSFHFDDQVLQYKPVLASPTPDRLKFGLGQQLADFFRFAFGKLLRVPYYAWLWILASMASLFNRLFQRGDKGSSEVVVRTDKPDPLDKSLLEKFEQVSKVKKLADQALVSPVGRSDLRSTPSLWGNLRKIIFGLLDGSNLGQFGVNRSENGWPVFYNVASVFKDPSEKHEVKHPNGGETRLLGWGQSLEGDGLLSELANSRLTLQSSMQEELAGIVDAGARIDLLIKQVIDWSMELGITNPLAQGELSLVEPTGDRAGSNAEEKA